MSALRYIRQTSLKDFGPESQKKLSTAKILVIGAGGLGIPVLQYLTAMGVGTIGIVENDIIDLSNLQRQVLYSENDVGKAKIEVAHKKLKGLNSKVNLQLHPCFLKVKNSLDIMDGYDLVVDASDNFPTRYLINDSCIILNKPFIYGALHGFEGQVSVFNYQHGPTYRCLFPNKPEESEIPNCDVNGVLGIIPSIIGSLQGLEAIKVLTGIGKVSSGELIIYEGLTQEIRKIRFPKNEANLKIKSLQASYGLIGCATTNKISAEEFAVLLKKNKDINVIDVRTGEEYETFHLEPSQNLPLQNFNNSTKILNQENRPTYVICQSGVRSQKAIDILNSENPQVTFVNVEGGLSALEGLITKPEI